MAVLGIGLWSAFLARPANGPPRIFRKDRMEAYLSRLIPIGTDAAEARSRLLDSGFRCDPTVPAERAVWYPATRLPDPRPLPAGAIATVCRRADGSLLGAAVWTVAVLHEADAVSGVIVEVRFAGL